MQACCRGCFRLGASPAGGTGTVPLSQHVKRAELSLTQLSLADVTRTEHAALDGPVPNRKQTLRHPCMHEHSSIHVKRAMSVPPAGP